MHEIEQEKNTNFHTKLFSWFSENKKDYPWRKTTDPYHIMVSEFMLQQTQTSRVVPKYLSFLEKFPTLQTLANADKRHVLELRSGLGYNRRAIWLKEASQKILSLGDFPKDPKELKKIKGIGDYTSRAIVIFAYNENIATVDTNIRRIFIVEGFATEETKEKELFAIAEQILPKNNSREYHSALMDYGNVILTSAKTKIKPKTFKGKFQGSNSQYRGRIIKYLTGHLLSTREEIKENCLNPEEKIDQILSKLVKDG